MVSDARIDWVRWYVAKHRSRELRSIMSKTDILLELPKLKREERQEIWVQLNELDGPINDEWTDDDLADEEKALIETRLNDCDMNPNAFAPWEEAEARLKAQFGA